VNVMLRPWLRPTPRLSGRIQRRYFKPRSKRQLIELNEVSTLACPIPVVTPLIVFFFPIYLNSMARLGILDPWPAILISKFVSFSRAQRMLSVTTLYVAELHTCCWCRCNNKLWAPGTDSIFYITSNLFIHVFSVTSFDQDYNFLLTWKRHVSEPLLHSEMNHFLHL